MGIVIEHRRAATMPIIACDTCGKEIVGRGNACFAVLGERDEVVFVHKSADSPGCDRDKDLYPWSIELDEFLDMIVNNFDQVAQGRKRNGNVGTEF